MLFSELLRGVEVLDSGGDLNVRVAGLAYDSRQVAADYLFVAIEGFNTDGHAFIAQAARQGAAALVLAKPPALAAGPAWVRVRDSRQALARLAANYYGDPGQKLRLVGVTGTNGKTTATNLLAAVFEAARRKVGLLGTIHNRIGARIIPGSHTTPESKELQELLNTMVEAGTELCVMEVSSHALALRRVEGCEFDLAVFTNFTRDHLDFHQTMENYLAAKLKLFEELKTPGQKGNQKQAVINADDAQAAAFIKAAQSAGARVRTYGVKATADVTATGIEIKPEGVGFTIKEKQGVYPIKLQLTGLFNVYNALAAFTAGTLMGVEAKVVIAALEGVAAVPGRFASVKAGQDFLVIVDYAHTPDGLENTLKTARCLTTGKLILVYGCGGDRDRGKRPLMGRIAAQYSDYQIITADNPRSEAQSAIAADILAGVREIAQPGAYSTEPDRREAINQAIARAGAGDLVLVAGKGHEAYQLIGGVSHPFDDTQEALKALRKTGGG